MANVTDKKAEIKARLSESIKHQASELYVHWGLTLNDAINIFLVKSIDVSGLPFTMKPEASTSNLIRNLAYKPQIDKNGIAILTASWDDYE
ncbi:MAG: type II toxin-antitoxin system RelB/DinJ family antitoxin [Eggerthellaceae bacterium]|nr:type II toxin-antitoxin system RelB/DinJ family antitoxin [Eggerthellaceae bacterium]